jgi:flagellar biosynthesis/type III secretory pathway chaperone
MTTQNGSNAGGRKAWQQLQRTLMDHVGACRELLSMIEEKQRMIIEGEVQGLQDLLPLEEKALDSIKTQINDYLKQMQQLAAGCDTAVEPLTLTNLFAHAPEPEQGSGSEIILALGTLLEQIEQVNHENRELLRVSSLFNRQMLDVLLPEDRNLTVYNASGGKEEKRREIIRMDKQI